MRKGYSARLVFDKKGHLVAIATGSDATSEHEHGSKELQSALSEQYALEPSLLIALREGRAVEDKAQFMRLKLISRFPPGLHFEQIEKSIGQSAEAKLWYCENDFAMTHYQAELTFPAMKLDDNDLDVAGAWDSRSFAIRVRGEKYVKALENFYHAILAKKVLFVSTFFNRKFLPSLAGVILANTEYLRAEDFAAMKQAEQKYVYELKLKAKDESAQIMREVRELTGLTLIGFIGPGRLDEITGEVLYYFNAAPGVNADTSGYYRKDQIIQWALNNGKHRSLTQKGQHRLFNH